MNKRISNGLSANNFSGQYIGFLYDRSFQFAKSMGTYHETIHRVGLTWGFQSRFFSSGHVDISIGLFNKQMWGPFPDTPSKNFINAEDFVLATQPIIGIAIGDWKRSRTAAKCEALFCEEDIRQQWKVGLPDITVGLKNQNIRADVALEKWLKSSPFSLQPKMALSYYRQYFTNDYSISLSTLDLSLELRYYAFQKSRVRKGKSGHNFSGPYASLLAGYHFFLTLNKLPPERQVSHVGNVRTEPAIGFQQRLFKKLFVDGSVFYSKNIVAKYIADRKGYFGSRLGLGFTF